MANKHIKIARFHSQGRATVVPPDVAPYTDH